MLAMCWAGLWLYDVVMGFWAGQSFVSSDKILPEHTTSFPLQDLCTTGSLCLEYSAGSLQGWLLLDFSSSGRPFLPVYPDEVVLIFPMAASGLLFYNIFKTWKNFVLITCFCLLLIFIFDWTTVDFPCCANLCCTAKWLRYIRIYILFLYPFPLWFLTGYWIQFPVLYSRTWLFIHPIYNSLHLQAPNSRSIPFLPPSPFWQRHICSLGQSLFYR